ncbi:putative cytochrome P450 [Caenibius tardaugens NBRC 16725]|uniref:Putative cytochrome P450 n=1 Tax=Caenibius tardaugens NBRC 16725 TaxID=1219035 RepID=U2Y425_9SPHN|nr:cytochrome P450 [Caenibius tardaugens]GAD47786.1 putative cytochrome P450 [Caenibius tardaugens NBRC 16725]
MADEGCVDRGEIAFDPHDPRFVDDGVPFPMLARIRQEQPVLPLAEGAWYLSRYDDVVSALSDVETFRSDLSAITGVSTGLETIPSEQLYLSEIEEPRHKEMRQLFQAVVTPSRLRELEKALEHHCHQLIDAMLQAPSVDLHEQYAMAIPAFAMARLMGFGDDAIAHFMAWSWDGTLMQRPCSSTAPPGGPRSHVYFGEAVAVQRRLPVPTNPVIAVMIDAVIEGRRLSDAEIVTQLHFMIQAGVHTTRSLLVHLVNRLVQDAALWAQLQDDRSLVPLFVEESLRRDAPVQRTTRRCTRDVVLNGAVMRAGDCVEIGIGSANHDERLFADGDDFLLDRGNVRRHIAFGTGSHFCPGAGLARLEARIMVAALLDRLERLEPVEGAIYPPLPGSLGHQPIPARLVCRP